MPNWRDKTKVLVYDGDNWNLEDSATKIDDLKSKGIDFIEKYYDGKSMIWPREIAPFLVEVLPLNVTNEETLLIAENLYKTLCEKRISVLLDDRDERAGVKFKDADLFGAPVEVVIGERNIKEGVVELRVRDEDTVEKVAIDNIASRVLEVLNPDENVISY